MFAHPAFDLDWNLVRTFVAVAQGGSLAAGARRLGITHPTAARHVQTLEETLGMGLFTRSGKGLVLNETGEALRDAAMTMHGSALELQNRIDALREAPQTAVRLTVPELLAELLPELLQPGLGSGQQRLDLVVSNDLLNLLQRDADLAVRSVRPQQQDLICKRVGGLRMGVFAAQSYVAEFGMVTMDNAGEHQFIDGLSHDYFVRGAAELGWCIPPERVVMRSDNIASKRAAVSAGWGIAAMPMWVAAQQSGWLQVLETEEPVELDVWLVARPDVRDQRTLWATFQTLGDALQSKLTEANRYSLAA